jgi:hypothetical protein
VFALDNCKSDADVTLFGVDGSLLCMLFLRGGEEVRQC